MVKSGLAGLERLVMGSVGVTARAVAEAAPDLPLLQWRVLVVLSEHPDGLAVSEIAERIGSRLPAASRLLSRMQAKGLVEARKDREDGRITTERLGPAGTALYAHVVERRRLDLAEALREADLGPDGHEAVAKLADAMARYL